MSRGGFAIVLGAALLLGQSAAGSGGSNSAAPSSAAVNANGNAFTGGLNFDPAEVSVRAGGTVTWTNTDPVVPHTATEDNGLWEVSGTYGATPASPPGFGPGESVGRDFDAGTFSYFCAVHPEPMKGVVAVPVKLSQRRHNDRWTVHATWGSGPLPDGQVFDVQRKRGPGSWKNVVQGSTKTRGSFAGGAEGTAWSFRARVRTLDGSAKSGWSPRATITAGNA